jgi:cell wall-associated NlpC family hydrolase
MPAVAGKTTYIPGRGSITRGKTGEAKKFTGSGPAPSGTTKAPERSYSEVPTVTISPSGKATTANFKSQRAAKAARKRTQATRRKTRAIVRQVAQRAQRAPVVPELPKSSGEPVKVAVSPPVKPEKFQGKPTAGTPTLKDLRSAANAGTLKVNQAGFATTPEIRRVGGELRKLRTKARSSNAPLPTLGPQESKVARKVLKVGDKSRATRKEKLAAAETGIVESGFRNLGYGDADSEGWRQERTSLYGPAGPRNVRAGAKRFYQESVSDTGGTRGKGMTAGELAQTIQGSAYPERYDEVKPQAAAILRAYEKGGLKPGQRKKLAATQAKAEKLGLRVAKPSKLGRAPKKVVTRFTAIKAAADALESKNFPFSWGGGHDASFSPGGEGENGGPGYDCSGSVSYVLHKAGVLDSPLTSGDMGSVLKPGPGAVTVFYNAEHTFMRIGDEYWGTSVGDSGAGGIGKHPAPSTEYLSQYSVGHVPGLGRKQALQLGFRDLNVAQSFPGMTLTSSGTTATIDPGAGATKTGKPGFSKRPIQLTPQQKLNRTNRKLKALGVGEPSTAQPASGVGDISELERKYGHATV